MTEKELFNKNLEIADEFSRFIVAHPEVAKKIPTAAEVIFLLESDPELTKHNLKLAEQLREGGVAVVFIKIRSIRPAQESRLIEPRLELAA